MDYPLIDTTSAEHIWPAGYRGTPVSGTQTADVTLFLSPITARELVACLAGFLGLRIEEPAADAREQMLKETGYADV